MPETTRFLMRRSAWLIALVVLVSCSSGEEIAPVDLLVFSKTASFRHASIDDAVAWFQSLEPEEKMTITFSEDASIFNDGALAEFDAVAFIHTTGDFLNDSQQAAFERFIQSGRGYVGIHAAADAEYEWPWYEDLVGALFRTHQVYNPIAEPIEYGGPFSFRVEDKEHPSTSFFEEDTFELDEEIYSYRRNPRWQAQVLINIEPSGLQDIPTLDGMPPMAEETGGDHPVSWYKEFDGGRSWYTSFGHDPGTWSLPWFQQHVLAGIRWAANGTQTFSKFTITDQTASPTSLAVLPDGKVYYLERTGDVRLWDPETGRVTVAATLEVSLQGENGLLGIVLDPDFEQNRFVYLYYSLALTDENVLSRFRAEADGTILVLDETELLRVPSNREQHEGGDLEFGPDGTLYLSVGDNTVPFGDSSGYAPLDERPGQESFNAQLTAGNPFDLRGKILRINTDGTIPDGNLYDASGEEGRPEVFVTGTRNPFRFAIDPNTGRVIWGDVGPDANEDTDDRGPRGYDEVNFADVPGDYGWPLCIAENLPYVDYDFESGASGEPFDCREKVPSALAYDYDTVSYLPLGARLTANAPLEAIPGRTALVPTMVPVVDDPDDQPFALPERFQGKAVLAEWTRAMVLAIQISEEGQVTDLRPLMPWDRFIRPIDAAVGPDGALYVLEFGTGFFGGNDDAGVVRVEHSAEGNLSPVAFFTVTGQEDAVGSTVEFVATGSRAPARGASIDRYEWDADGDGEVDGTGRTLDFAYDASGPVTASLTVVDSEGRRSFPFVRELVVGNTPPTVTIADTDDPERALGDEVTVASGIPLTLIATPADLEDESVDCATVQWSLALGHDSHAHPESTVTGCNFTLDDTTLPPHTDDPNDLVFWAIEARYTDGGGADGQGQLTGSRGIVILVE
ncbi:MAG: ThuA domain-containing protein [Myxococcota bacterium]